jgi:hypothetical protein
LLGTVNSQVDPEKLNSSSVKFRVFVSLMNNFASITRASENKDAINVTDSPADAFSGGI